MNIFAVQLDVEPDIWGAMTATVLFALILLIIPFVDREKNQATQQKCSISKENLGIFSHSHLLGDLHFRHRPKCNNRRGLK